MSETMYLVERFGVYHQGTIGVFSTEDKAKSVAFEMMKREPDAYHDIKVTMIETDTNLEDCTDGESSIEIMSLCNGERE